jgi:hypothetical protein
LHWRTRGGLCATAGKITQYARRCLHRGHGLRVLLEAAVSPAGHKNKLVVVHSLSGSAPDGVHQRPLRHGLFFKGTAKPCPKAVHAQLGRVELGLRSLSFAQLVVFKHGLGHLAIDAYRILRRRVHLAQARVKVRRGGNAFKRSGEHYKLAS